MADDAVIQKEPPDDAPPPPPSPGGSHAGRINEEVDGLLVSENSTVRGSVVRRLADETLENRKKMAFTGLSKIKEARAALNKIRPKPTGYDATGRSVGEVFDKAQIDDMKKHKELIAKVEAALDDAFNRANYEKLQKICGGDKST